LTLDLYGAIIINVSVGMGNTKLLIDFEQEDGSITKKTLIELIPLLFLLNSTRIFEWNNVLFPQFLTWYYKSKDRRLARNIDSIRNAIQNIINERRSGNT
jgi:hypothetical protein